MSTRPSKYRSDQLKQLTKSYGVYALCDLDEVPIYVGQSSKGKGGGISHRVRRHLTSARSDAIANRVLDVWEVAFVWAWPCNTKAEADAIEAWLFNEFDPQSQLMNGKPLKKPPSQPALPDKQCVQVLPLDEISRRRQREFRFPRQVQQVTFLLDYLLEVKNDKHIRRALAAHFARLARYHGEFQDAPLTKARRPKSSQ